MGRWTGIGMRWAALALWLAGAGCATPDPGRKLAWRTLSKGLVSGLHEPGRTVIRSEVDYFKLWTRHAADSARIALPPAVDFEREMVVVVTLGNRPTGGYVVDVVDVELRGRTLRVLTGERKPKPGTFQVQQQTQPYVMVALPAMNARVDFREVQEAAHADSGKRVRPATESPARKAADQEPREPSKPRTPVIGREPAAGVGNPRGGRP